MVRVAALVVLAVVGFFAGRALHPASPVVGNPAPGTTTTVIGMPPEVRGDPCDNLALVEALLARTQEAIEGVFVPFPDDPRVSPAVFHRLLDDAERNCPDMAVDHVDCEEYPCIAWVRDTLTCMAARDHLTGAPAEIFDLTLGDGEQALWQVLFLTAGEHLNVADPRKSMGDLRYETRTLQARDRIVRTTDARPITEVELWTNRVAEFEEKVEDAPNPVMRYWVNLALDDARERLNRAREREERP